MFKNAKEVEEYIYSSYVNRYPNIPKGDDVFSRNPHLTRMLLDDLGGVDKKQKNIMITGSKGKGSLSVILAKILEGHGLKVGLFTSPHLRDYRERIRINGQGISEEGLIELGNRIKPYYDKIEHSLPPHKYIGPVGATAAMAMSYFYEQKTDINVVECGRGARYDDVNQIHGFIGGINKIFLEHVGPLGYTIDDVAHHKAGLIKKWMRAVYSAEQTKYPDLILRYEVRKCEIPLFIYNQDFYSYDVSLENDGTHFSVKTKFGEYKNLVLSLLGKHQSENAALAIAIAEGALGKELNNQILIKVLKNIRWPGRMEIINQKPLAILDGCISVESFLEVKGVIDFLDYKNLISIVAIPMDKDYLGVLDELGKYGGKVIMTHARNDYLKFSEEQVAEAAKIYPITFIKDVDEALKYGQQIQGDKDLLLCLGTQSFIKDTKIYLNEDTLNI